MNVLSLNIECHERGFKKTMQFEPNTPVHDICRMVRDKLGPMSGNPNDYGLFRVEDDLTKCVWMENGRTLEYYLIRNGDTLEYKNKIRSLRIRTLDGGAVKTIFVDESQPVSQSMVVICSKMGIANHEEYSLFRGFSPALDGTDENGYGFDQHQILKGSLENTFMNTIGRKKEKQLQQLRVKLHTEEKINWVDHSKTLREQNICENEELTLTRKFFFSDTNVDTRDPAQLNLLYIQCRDGVLHGLHPVGRVEVKKESVEDRLAEMGAATAEVVQLTAIPEESIVDTSVGNTIATISSNLPEMGRGVLELAALMPDEHRAGDLVDADWKPIATSTPHLFLQAMTVSADCDDFRLKDQVIQSAMKTPYSNSDSVPCTHVVTPILHGSISSKRRPRRRPNSNVLLEIRKYRKTTDMMIPRSPFSKLFKEILQNALTPGRNLKVETKAIDALHESSESFITTFYEAANRCAIHARRETVKPEDFNLVRWILNAFGINTLR